MSHYSHLLSPLRVGNVFLKNRMVAANALPHFLQGPESFPAEPVIDHIAGLARNGAAIVTFADWFDQRQRTFFNPDGKRFPMYDPKDPSVENYLSQMADAVHFYGSKIALAIMHFGPVGYEIVDTPAMDTDFKIDMTDIGGMSQAAFAALEGRLRGGQADHRREDGRDGRRDRPALQVVPEPRLRRGLAAHVVPHDHAGQVPVGDNQHPHRRVRRQHAEPRPLPARHLPAHQRGVRPGLPGRGADQRRRRGRHDPRRDGRVRATVRRGRRHPAGARGRCRPGASDRLELLGGRAAHAALRQGHQSERRQSPGRAHRWLPGSGRQRRIHRVGQGRHDRHGPGLHLRLRLLRRRSSRAGPTRSCRASAATSATCPR